MLLTTREVAALLKVHPKHVYRLLKRGLPAHRVGDEWRFDEDEVRRFCRERGEPPPLPPEPRPAASPLLAANGDVVVERLLGEARRESGLLLGHVPADHEGGLDLLRRGEVLVAGCHGDAAPSALRELGLARLHLVEREVGLAFRKGLRLRRITELVGKRLAARPRTAGIRAHLDAALAAAGVEADRVYQHAAQHASHRDAVMAVCREEADVGLASRAWAASMGLSFLPLASEAYGLLLRVEDLADRRVMTLCETAQRGSLRSALSSGLGYDVGRTGELRVHAPSPALTPPTSPRGTAAEGRAAAIRPSGTPHAAPGAAKAASGTAIESRAKPAARPGHRSARE